MSKQILLARTHPMIVDAMRSFLSRNQFTPIVETNLEGLSRHGTLNGVVVSTSVVSGTKETYQEVLKRVMKALPRTPILVATMAGYDVVKKATQGAVLDGLDVPVTLLEIRPETLTAPELGSPKGLLVVHRDQLQDPLTDQVIGKHFA